MNKTRAVAMAVSALAILGAGASTAHADYGTQGYNTTVGRFNGDGYSGSERKSFTDDSGRIYSGSVGGNYQVDARMISQSGTWLGSGWARIDDGTVASLTNWLTAGTWVRVHFSNDLGTRVNVQVTGSWYEA